MTDELAAMDIHCYPHRLTSRAEKRYEICTFVKHPESSRWGAFIPDREDPEFLRPTIFDLPGPDLRGGRGLIQGIRDNRYVPRTELVHFTHIPGWGLPRDGNVHARYKLHCHMCGWDITRNVHEDRDSDPVQLALDDFHAIGATEVSLAYLAARIAMKLGRSSR